MHPFDELMQLPEDRIRLAAAALWYARDAYPDLKVPQYMHMLNAAATRVDKSGARSADDQVEALRREIVDHLGFHGDRDNYRNPENSYLNRVIERRAGIPVTLAALWLDAAEQLGWPLAGVNLPGHFLLCVTVPGQELYVDPYNEGRVMSLDDVARLCQNLFGTGFALRPAHLAPVGTKRILLRMLSNLRAYYLGHQDWRRAARVLERMLALRPQEVRVAAELAQVLAHTGEPSRALAIVHRLLSSDLPADEEEFMRHQLEALHRFLAEQN